MMHPLFKLLVSRPELLAQHAGGYARLLAIQTQQAAQQVRRQAVLAAVVALGLMTGVGLAGVALLLLAALPVSQMPAPWLLGAVPLVPLAMAGWAAWSFRVQPMTWSLDLLRDQWSDDLALMREVAE